MASNAQAGVQANGERFDEIVMRLHFSDAGLVELDTLLRV